MELTSKQRSHLKGLAQTTGALFQIGKSNLTPEITTAVEEAFNNRELIKITVLKNASDNPFQMGQVLAERTKSELVQVIGHTVVLYKPSKEHKIKLPC